jgi:GT2 family glycosyltransferase
VTTVSAVIGNYQGEHLLPDVLASLTAQTHVPAEVLVVDGSSTDASRAVAEAHVVRFIEQPNRGLGFLYNRGLEQSTSEYVLLLNNDVSLDLQCIELLASALSESPDRFASDPRQWSWDGQRLVHGRTIIRRAGYLRKLMPGFDVDLRAPADDLAFTLCTNGGAMMVRRCMALDLGGFDETFFLDFEDLDLCWRAWLRGWSSVHVPNATVRHRVGAATTPKLRKRRLVSSHHNLMRFAVKCLPRRDASAVLATEIVRLVVHPTTVGRALAQTLREAPQILRQRRLVKPADEFLEWALAGMDATSSPGRAPQGDSRAAEGRASRPGRSRRRR